MIAYLTTDGTVRFEADTYTPAEGETQLPALPAWDAATHRIEWTGSAWQTIALDAAALAAKAAEAVAIADQPTVNKAAKVLNVLMRAIAGESDPDFAGIIANFPLALKSWANSRFATDARVDNVVNAAQTHVADNDAHNMAAQLAAKAASVHGHAIDDVTALQAVLTALGGSYRTLIEASGSHAAAKVAATYALANGEALAVSGTGTVYPIALVQIAAADWPTIGGVAPKLRIRVQLATNDTAPTGTYTFGLHPVTRPATSGGAGLCIFTLGAAVAGSNGAVFSAPAADSVLTAVGADFALPANGIYALGMVQTGTVANNAHMHIAAQLQIHNA